MTPRRDPPASRGGGPRGPGIAECVYLDHAATTPMRPVAVEAMLPFLAERFGNPSGSHAVARAARAALDEAREVVAEALGAEPGEIVFTSGGTESDNTAIAGVLDGPARTGAVVCSAIEHPAVLEACRRGAARSGRGLVEVPVSPAGLIDLDALAGVLADALAGGVSVVSVMLANNEVGTVQPLTEVAGLVRRHAPRAVLHTDAVQAVPWVDVAGLTAVADLVSVSAHKLGGPKGVGALVVRAGTRIEPLLVGGGQERDRRSGTPDVAGIVAFAAALSEVVAERDAVAPAVGALRDRLVDGILTEVEGASETGDRSSKVASNAHLRFAGVSSEELLFLLDDAGICASAGSSCASGAIEPSHVLTAMGFDVAEAGSAVRFSLGPTTSREDVDRVLAVLPGLVRRLRR